jgi:hypothetical protein
VAWHPQHRNIVIIIKGKKHAKNYKNNINRTGFKESQDIALFSEIVMIF